MTTVINASAAVTLLGQGAEKIQALSGIPTHDLCDAGAAQLGAVRALLRHRRGRGFESRSEPEFFQ